MTVSLDALNAKLVEVNRDIVGWTQRKTKAQQVLDRATTRLGETQADKAQLEADIAAYTPA